MAGTELTSFIGWIDLSEEDQKRARDYLRSLSEGTIDELGFGVIRDTFAELFFPATSTIMTRARYFILVPAIYQRQLDAGLTGKTAERKCLELEKRLRTLYRQNGAMEDTRKEEVTRYPASIYWGGLRRVNIYQRQGSQANYFGKLKEYLDLQQTMEDDDDNKHAEDGIGELWDPEFLRLYENGDLPVPDENGDFPDDTDLELTWVEANYLCDKYTGDAENTIIAHLLEQQEFESFTYPWQCSYPTELEREVRHAERFSMLSKLATLVYYQMLIELRRRLGLDTGGADLTDSIQLWWETASAEVTHWDVEDFLKLAADMKCLRGNDRGFITEFHAAVGQAQSGKHFCEQKDVQNLITAREKDKRPHKRRLREGRFLREWKLPGSSGDAYFSDPYRVRYHLDYRGRIASRIVDDIFAGLER